MLVKIGKHIGFCVYRRSCLLWSPVIVPYSSGGPSIVPIEYSAGYPQYIVPAESLGTDGNKQCGSVLLIVPVAGTYSAGMIDWRIHTGTICSGNRHYCCSWCEQVPVAAVVPALLAGAYYRIPPLYRDRRYWCCWSENK